MTKSMSAPAPREGRRLPRLALVVLGVFSLFAAACGDDDGTEAEDGGSSDLSFGIIIPSSIEDGSFGEEGYSGFLAGVEESGAENAGFVENVAVDAAVEAMANLASEGADVVIALGGQFAQAGVDVAPQFPDTHFVVINGTETAENLSSWSISEGEIAYLGGIMVAATLEPDHLARVAGLEIAPMQFGSAGFIMGARSVDPDIEYTSTFTGDFDDTAAALEATSSAFSAGADLVYTGMNNAIVGQEQAAEEAGGLLLNNAVDKCDDPEVGDLYYGVASGSAEYAVMSTITGISSGELEAGFDKLSVEDPAGYTVELCDAEIPAEVQELMDAAVDDLVNGRVSITLDAVEG